MEKLQNVSVNKEHRLVKQLVTQDCLKFLVELHRNYNNLRKQLLKQREERQQLFDKGQLPTYPPETQNIRDGDWKADPYPSQLDKRWIEITCNASYKMCVNAMNTKSDAFMADFEDALAPSWDNILSGQQALIETNLRTLQFTEKGKEYKLKEGPLPLLLVRPRGLHLEESNITCDGESMSGSFVDFGLYFFHNYNIRIQKYGGVFYYLPKMESYQEARLWDKVFTFTEQYFKVPIGTIKVTVLIETILGSINQEEIIYELRHHISACNAGRWDYIFSIIKKFRNQQTAVLPDRTEVTMTVPFMRAYTERLVHICHKRGIHAIGGMAAQIPSKSDEAFNKIVFQKVIDDKTREVNDGYDGSWVAHPKLVDLAREVFEKKLGQKNHQKDNLRADVKVEAKDLLNFKLDKPVTEAGVRMNISVGIQYLYYWLNGQAAVGLNNLMEDAATAEIARGQLWQWIKYQVKTNNGLLIDDKLYLQIKDEEVKKFGAEYSNKAILDRACEINDNMVLSVLDNKFDNFLTNVAYPIMLNFEIYKNQEQQQK